jgi:ABC-2 type transport system permease protein/capsular polysaccharide transport system permease protein
LTETQHPDVPLRRSDRDTPFVTSWDIQVRVVGALLMRETLTRYGRHNIGFLWLFVEPMMFTLGVTLLWTMTKSLHGGTISITAFALTGYSSVLLWRNMPVRCISALEPNRTLFFHRNVRMLDIFVARLVLEFGGATISFLLLGLIFIAAGLLDFPEDLLKVIAGWFMLAWFGMALGLLLGTLSIRHELVEKLWHPISYLTLPLSGAAYIVDALPDKVQPLALYLPMVNGIELLREGYFGSYAKAHYDIPYMAACSLVMTLIGLLQLRLTARSILVG